MVPEEDTSLWPRGAGETVLERATGEKRRLPKEVAARLRTREVQDELVRRIKNAHEQGYVDHDSIDALTASVAPLVNRAAQKIAANLNRAQDQNLIRLLEQRGITAFREVWHPDSDINVKRMKYGRRAGKRPGPWPKDFEPGDQAVGGFFIGSSPKGVRKAEAFSLNRNSPVIAEMNRAAEGETTKNSVSADTQEDRQGADPGGGASINPAAEFAQAASEEVAAEDALQRLQRLVDEAPPGRVAQFIIDEFGESLAEKMNLDVNLMTPEAVESNLDTFLNVIWNTFKDC